jgi:hypothetical protein
VKKYDRYEVVEPEKKFKPEKQKQDVKNNETVTLKMSAPDFTNQPIPSFGQTNAGQGTIPNDADYLPKQPAVTGNPVDSILAWVLDKMPKIHYSKIDHSYFYSNHHRIISWVILWF